MPEPGSIGASTSRFTVVSKRQVSSAVSRALPIPPRRISTWRAQLQAAGVARRSLRHFPATHSQRQDWVAGKWLFERRIEKWQLS